MTDHAHTASVVLKPGIIQPVGLRPEKDLILDIFFHIIISQNQ
jgi:hypothetical protein